MQKICTFPKYLGKVKIVKNCKKPREKCIFSAYFLRIFCIFSAYFIKNQRTLPKNWRYAKNMQKICTFLEVFCNFWLFWPFPNIFGKVHIFCIFSAYFLHIANFWQFSLIFNEICKKYAENTQKIYTFLEVFCNFWLFWPFPNISEKCIFSAYFSLFANFWQFSLIFNEICKKYAENMHFSRGFFDFLKELATTKSAYAIVHIFCRVFAYIFQSAYFLHIAPCHQKRIAI